MYTKTLKMTKSKTNVLEPLITLAHAMEEIADTPDMEFLYWGIPKAPSVTLIAARAKAGKSIFMENMAYALVDENVKTFLGLPIKTVNRVAVISFEEPLHLRTQRQMKQIKGLKLKESQVIMNKIWVFNKGQKQFLANKEQQEGFLEIVKCYKPEVIFIDSLGRLGTGQIEDSKYAQEIMLFIRVLSTELDCPVIVLHHTVKSKKYEDVELSSMAGSRVISQEGDGMICIFDGPNSEKILKPLAWRYHGDNDTEIHFRITEDCLVEYLSTKRSDNEPKQMSSLSKTDVIKKYLKKVGSATTNELEEVFVNSGIMARSTMFVCLQESGLTKSEKGIYTYPIEKNKFSHQYMDEIEQLKLKKYENI